ncbi:LamG-like jellyroll fold domain-containing protein [Poriferisphaera sp. WC338]|uniref:LamG domain-containing protein n=1 Tax=Poriferisphaera sp. WC338 TaxID=3425129 RepID=UPI003D8186E3
MNSTFIYNSNPRSHGIAMLLVMFALVIGSILAATFIATSSTSVGIAQNVSKHATARSVAESGLELAINYVKTDADWRTTYASGQWIADESFAGGTFSVYGTDEDGDLSDDASDKITLRVVGTFGGVTHEVSANIQPGGEEPKSDTILFVVYDADSLDGMEYARKEMLEELGFTVNLIDRYASQSVYDAAFAENACVYVPYSYMNSTVAGRVKDAPIGVVYDYPDTNSTIGIAHTGRQLYMSGTYIYITNNSHPITSSFSTGYLQIKDDGSYVTSANYPADDAVSLGLSHTTTPQDFCIVTLEKGKDDIDGNAVAGRRVLTPYGDSMMDLTTDGKTLLKNILIWASDGGEISYPPVPIVAYDFTKPSDVTTQLVGHWKLDEDVGGIPSFTLVSGLRVQNEIELWDDIKIESKGSKDNAFVATNSTVDSIFEMSGKAEIKGSGYCGVGGDPYTAIRLWDSSKIKETRGALSALMDLPVGVAVPDDLPASSGALELGDKDHYDVPEEFGPGVFDVTYSSLTLTEDAKFHVKDDIRVHVTGDLIISAKAEIDVSSHASVVFYVGGDVSVYDEAEIGKKDKPEQCVILMYGNDKKAIFSGDKKSKIYALLANPKGGVEIWEDTEFDGAITAESFKGGGKVKIKLRDDVSYDVDGSDSSTTIATDSSTAGNDGIYNGAKSYASGKINGAIEFNGVSDYIAIPHVGEYLLDHGTVSFWFKTDTVSPNYQGLFTKDLSSYGNGGLMSVILQENYIRLLIKTDQETVYTDASSIPTVPGTWYHVAACWGDDGTRLYVNGVQRYYVPYYGGLGETSGGTGNTESIMIGANGGDRNTSSDIPLYYYFNGVMDDIRVYDGVLDGNQIANLYNLNEPGPRTAPPSVIEDISNYGDPADLHVHDSTKVAWVPEIFSGPTNSLRINDNTLATTDIIHKTASKLHDAIQLTREFSAEIQFTPTNLTNDQNMLAFSENSNQRAFAVGQHSDQFAMMLRTADTSSRGVPDMYPSVFLNTAKQHYVVTYDGTDVKMYQNGTLVYNEPRTGSINVWDVDNVLALAGDYEENTAWKGTFHRVAIYNVALNADQVDDVFNGLPPREESSGSGTFEAVWVEQE